MNETKWKKIWQICQNDEMNEKCEEIFKKSTIFRKLNNGIKKIRENVAGNSKI